ncbi:phosphatase PAP2 family protein [Alicyclobacillus fastidiosus]|uniref:Phosphatase PAP2 family protein n=1 Tax=Alicyclobacillus fastidiosus TaxID=392011 RepID=A0ABV5AF00_9BACL|nr:phosphatase PAP2 family protein [Alicyclobacillus fastidiosus]WEH09418.1 phosphatase PAP2 family protein [Alicyclobacillus fastidiosus]
MATPKFSLPAGFGWQYHAILWLQSFHTPILDKVAMVMSYLGTESFYLIILPMIMLVFSRQFGLRMTYVFLTSMFFNAWLKSVIQIARPIGVPGIRSGYVSSATGLSMPSGHAQGAMTLYAAVVRPFSNRVLRYLLLLVVLCIGISRIYLGLHWPMDVFVGWLLGLVIGSSGWQIGRWWSYREIPWHFALLFAVLFPAVLFYFNHDPLGAEYATYLFAVGTGAVLERRFVHSRIDGVWWKRICAGVLGLGGIVAIQWLLQGAAADLPGRLLRDLLDGWWVTVGAPWAFLKLNVYQINAEELAR